MCNYSIINLVYSLMKKEENMASLYSVSFVKIVKEFNLEEIWAPEDVDAIRIETNELNRPGLQFTGFYDLFDTSRIQIIGKTEYSYLKSLGANMLPTVEEFFIHKPAIVIFTWNMLVDNSIVNLAKKYNIPLYRTTESTSEFMAGITHTLSIALAKRITRHGVFVEVYGEGVLLYGESGVGKSEVAMELIKRGHRLIADDAVEIRRVSKRTLVGTSPENIRHFMELRGVGIINARNLFGMGSVKKSSKLDMVINLEPWDNDKVYDRMGAKDVYTKILDVEVPLITIPVQPGRNLAVIVEVAAMNNRQKRMGDNAAIELMERLAMPPMDDIDDIGEWDSYYGLDE